MVTKIVDGVKIEITDKQATDEYLWVDSDAKKLKKIKEKRADKLQETDWWVLRGNMTEEQKNYRQKLRDIPADYDSSKYDELLNFKTHVVWKKPTD
tara:strand:+ start:439 stop:726 length:288 start_codon:yes stop_codon:yes gene_type:complete